MSRSRSLALLVLLATVSPATAQVAFDAASSSSRTGTTDPHTWTHTPAGTPKGVLCGASHGVTATTHIVSATYGGVSMSFLRRGADTSGEPGVAEVWWLGSSVPTGPQTVSFDLTPASTGDDIVFSCITVTAVGNTTTSLSLSCVTANANQANPNCTTSTVASAQRVMLAVNYYGGSAPGACANETTTSVIGVDMGNFSSLHCRSGDLTDTAYTCGMTQVADDEVLVCAALEDLGGGGGGSVVKDPIGNGIVPFAR